MDEPTLEELQRAARPSFRMSGAGRRRPDQRGGGEALETIGGALAGSVPAGLAGLAVLPFRGPAGAAETVERVQDVFTPMPTTEGGVRATMGLARGLAPLGAPAQAVGDVTLRATDTRFTPGGSPLAATAAEIVLDPLNAAGLVAAGPALRAGARAAGRNVKRAGQSAVQNLGPKVAELAESYMRRSGMTPEITTYHGTPHTFAAEPGLPLGRFRAEKIGSGEGAQTYGHGLYFAESPDVAKTYVTAGIDKSQPLYVSQARMVATDPTWGSTLEQKAEALARVSGNRAANYLRQNFDALVSEKGAIYKVDIPDEMIGQMLDWDAPMSKQPQSVLEALSSKTGVPVETYRQSSKTGKQVWQTWISRRGSPEEASAALQEIGIPGIKYLDQGSRSEGQGTRNFVVFPGEEQNLRILERDGVKAENAVKKAQGGAVEGSDMSYSHVVDRIKSGLVQGGMDGGQAMDAALRMAEAKMKSGGAVMMAGGGSARRTRYEGPMPNRPVVNGRAVVSTEELADFRRQFGADKTLRDLLNADRGLTRRGETPSAQDMRARGPQGPSEAPASPYSDPSRVMEGVAASQREIARPGRDAVEPVVPELALALAPRIAQLLGVSASALRARLTAAGKDWRNTPPRGADKGRWDAIVKQIDEAYPQAAAPTRVETPPLGTGRSAPDLEPMMQAGGPVRRLTAAAAARAAARAEARLAEKAAKEAAEKAAQGAATPVPPRTLTGALRPAADPVRGKTSLELLAQQRQALTPEQRAVLSDLRRKYPDFGESTKFMTPQEIIKVVERPENAAAMNRLLQVLPSSQNLAAVAKAGEPKRGWYRASTQAIIDVFGLQDAPRFSALLAAMSPQTSVEMNLLNTLNTWKNWTAAGRPNDPAEIRRIMGQSVAGTKGEKSVLEAWAQNATRALTAEDPAKITLSGPKVDSFYRNLADDVYRVTNDAWMASGLGVSQNLFSGAPTALQLGRGDPGLTPGYMATSARMREAGQRAGILPSEAQETTWSFFMPAYEMQRELNLPARDILQRGLLTPERIRGTPDFATLLGQGKYGDILKQAGYEEQLSRLTPTQFGAARTDLSLPEQREIEAAAQRLEALRSQRSTESRSRSISLPPKGQSPQTAFAVEPQEYIPGAGVRLGESMVTAPLGTREHYSSAISSLFRDPAGRDRLQRAVGLNPLPTRAGTGAFRPSGEIPYQGMVTEEARGQRMPVESQPAFASVAEVPVVRGGLDISQKAKERLGAAAATRGYMTGQHGSTYNVHIPRASGESFMVPLEGKADPDAMRYTYQLLDDAGYLADTGAGVNVLFNKYKQGNVPFTPKERTDIQTILGGQGIVPGRNVSEYIDYSPAWMGPEGSGAATRELLGRIEPLSGREKTALSKETQDIAGGLYDLYTKKGEKTKDEYRSDVMRALQILRDKGLPGLAAALAAGEALPSQEQGGLRAGSR